MVDGGPARAPGLRLLVSCLVLAASVATVASSPARATATVRNCGSFSTGPGAVEHGSPADARCLLRAYQRGCESAVYVLSSFGVDTVATDRFRVARASGRCVVDVTISFQIVPQPARRHLGVCRTLALKTEHVVAGRCTGANVPRSIVLDPKS